MALKINGKRVAMSVISKIVPTGKKTVTENGTYDVESFVEIEVNVPIPEPPAPDNIVFKKTVDIPSLKNSGTQVWISQQELVDAGFLDDTTENLYNKYADLLVDVQLQSNTHVTNQLLQQRSSKLGFNYSGNNKYYKTAYKHGNSTTAATAAQSNVVMTTSTNGFCNYSTANGVYAAINTSYQLPANSSYMVTLVAIK